MVMARKKVEKEKDTIDQLFNDQIISMYSFGMTDRDIKSHLERYIT
jgi:transposase-like protein